MRTPPSDPVALSLVAALLVVIAIAASIWPASRAARVNPGTALRHE